MEKAIRAVTRCLVEISTCHFAGEVVIPLREIEDMAGEVVDVKRYILARRTTKEKVLPALICPLGTIVSSASSIGRPFGNTASPPWQMLEISSGCDYNFVLKDN